MTTQLDEYRCLRLSPTHPACSLELYINSNYQGNNRLCKLESRLLTCAWFIIPLRTLSISTPVFYIELVSLFFTSARYCKNEDSVASCQQPLRYPFDLHSISRAESRDSCFRSQGETKVAPWHISPFLPWINEWIIQQKCVLVVEFTSCRRLWKDPISKGLVFHWWGLGFYSYRRGPDFCLGKRY